MELDCADRVGKTQAATSITAIVANAVLTEFGLMAHPLSSVARLDSVAPIFHFSWRLTPGRLAPGWLRRSTPGISFPPCMRSWLQGSDFYPGGFTSSWTHPLSPGHTVRLLSPDPLVVEQPKSTPGQGADIVSALPSRWDYFGVKKQGSPLGPGMNPILPAYWAGFCAGVPSFWRMR